MDREQLTQDLPVGGQAVIEGVMMRVPGKIVTAVRAADHQIVVREEAYDSSGATLSPVGSAHITRCPLFF